MKAKWVLLVPFTMVTMAVTLNSTYAAKSRQQSGRSRGVQLPAGAKIERNIVYARVGDRKLLLDLCLPAKGTSPLLQ